ncbi:MAG: thermonuclease family protein [Schumannella sp.]
MRILAVLAVLAAIVIFVLAAWLFISGGRSTDGQAPESGGDPGSNTGTGAGMGTGTGTGTGNSADPQMPPDAVIEIVDYVHDGDTLFLRPTTGGGTGAGTGDRIKVRLLGVDTPEIGEHAECYGIEARDLLREWLPEGTRVHVVADVQPFDQYGRSLLFLFLDDGSLVNLDLIEAGAAEAVVLKPNVLWADELEAAEDRAQSASLGMWGAC